ncbi:HAD-IIIC family phosphatase [Paracoccus sp. (in: a-proteobacteria)]|jgi:FkbH-like protein|uniref:HAD-IIIC family phosphatase n=1 Tax=Paracoccus sp. TaxID=267 RepID=UPI00258B74D6|nr:HAD-IIIC family phosphatase [Paracoccus sp. (in: a-proteobacteria)]
MFVLSQIPADLKREVLAWRNAEAVRCSMITRDPISEENHFTWWDRVAEDRSKRLLMLADEASVLGVITFFGIEGGSAWWGFYPSTDAEGRTRADLASWLAMEQAALVYAFDVLKLDRLLCETRHDNAGVLSLHDRVGFRTLAPDDFPNALAHKLIVKEMDRVQFSALRKAGDLPDASMLKVEPHVFDLPPEPQNRIAVLGSANWDLGARTLADRFEIWTGQSVHVHTPPFGQAMLQLLDSGSDLRRSQQDLWIFADRYEDFCDPFAVPGMTANEIVQARFSRYLSLIRQMRTELKGVFLIHDIAPTKAWPQSLTERVDGSGPVGHSCAAMNAELAALCRDLPDCHLLPVSSVIDEVGRRNADPGKYWLLGRIAYGGAFYEAWSRMVAGFLLALRGQTARAVVFDLDNTLWGGVIGDDGISGIQLSSDYPGNDFKAVQGVGAALKARGLPLTISSKNTEHVALDAIRNHPEMVLREGDFVTHRINWNVKSQNIREMAAELSLGLGSFMFIDDNPVERAEVRRNAPGVIVPEMPEDVSLWPEFILDHPALAAISLSAEDLGRVKSYEIRRQIINAEQNAISREAFLAELGMTLEVLPVTEATQQRVSQLIAKTNQFNTTARRYSQADLADLAARGGELLTLRLKDKYGSDELIGVVVADYRPEEGTTVVDNFIMSCRVLNRGVEAGGLAVLSERALRRGCTALRGQIIPTERNEPCRKLYSDNGFVPLEDGWFEHPLGASPLPRPAWLTVETNE